MPQQTIIQTSFNSGEVSPLLAGRVDVEKYSTSCAKLQNFIPLVQGPACKRGGIRYIGEAKFHDKACILIPFRRSATENYILEFGDKYIRFWRDRGQIMSGGVPYEITSPYSLANIINPDGTKGIHYVQSGDSLYLACAGVYPQKLTKNSLTNWTIGEFIPVGGPWDEPNTNEALKIAASGKTGTITLTSNFDTFSSTDIGRQVRLEVESYESYPPWEADRSYADFASIPQRIRWEQQIYSFVTARQVPDGSWKPNSGNVPPIHHRGSVWDGSGIKPDKDGDMEVKVGVKWKYENCGYGIASITAVTNARQATAKVQTKYPFPEDINTYRWTFGAWHGGVEYPRSVTFFRERLAWSGGNKVWFSKVGDFSSFEDKDYVDVTPENAVTLIITSDSVDNVAWGIGGETMCIGTEGGTIGISESNGGEPFGPANVKQSPQDSKGVLSIQPVRSSGALLFSHISSKQLYELVYDFNSDSFRAMDVSVLSEHLLRPGLKEFSFGEEKSILWCVRKDGRLLGFTYDRHQNVVGWHQHPLGGSGKVTSIALVPSPDGTSEDLYLATTITISGATKRYINYLDPGFTIGVSKIEDSFFVDFGKTVISATPITTVPTLEHLEGRTVAVLVDGATHPDVIVFGGKITLESPAKTIQVGLKYEAVLETNNIEAGAATGTAQGANKALKSVALRVIDSSGGYVGPTITELQEIYARDVSDNLDTAPGLTSGDLTPAFHSQFETAGRAIIYHNTPLPFNLLALIQTVDTKR